MHGCSPPGARPAIGRRQSPRPVARRAGSAEGARMTSTLDALAGQAALIGGPGEVLADDAVAAFVAEQLAAQDLDGRSVCVIIPDATRSCPLPLLLSAVHGALHGRVTRLTVLIALGTHAPLDQAELSRHLGYAIGELESHYPGMDV